MRSNYCLLLVLPFLVSACQNSKPAQGSHSLAPILSKKSTENHPASKVPNQTLSAGPAVGYPDISGYYKEVDDEQTGGQDEGCNIALNIRKTSTGYRYRLSMGETPHTGKVTLERQADRSNGIILEGIPYAEYEGDVSQLKDDDDRPQPKLPVGISGLLNGDTIMIQNYGNAMNYYVQLGGCQLKYLSLIRIHR